MADTNSKETTVDHHDEDEDFIDCAPNFPSNDNVENEDVKPQKGLEEIRAYYTK
jgi:hypothetical protein